MTETHVKPPALEVDELLRRRHKAIGIRRTTKGETGKRNATYSALFDGPSDCFRMARFD